MLIVIVIIGILAAALIPRVTGMQARARDTARTADMRNVSTAIESYKIDHNSYPIAIYAFVKPAVSLSTLLLPTTFAQTAGSSLDSISSSLSSYMTSLPKDPKGTGISSSSAGECITAGSSYAYYTDPSGSLYAITSTKESKKGNASACGDTIDKNNDGNFQKVGQGLKINISYTTNNRYNPATDGDPVERCLLRLTQADTDELNTTLNSTRTKEEWCSLTDLSIQYNYYLTSIPQNICTMSVSNKDIDPTSLCL